MSAIKTPALKTRLTTGGQASPVEDDALSGRGGDGKGRAKKNEGVVGFCAVRRIPSILFSPPPPTPTPSPSSRTPPRTPSQHAHTNCTFRTKGDGEWCVVWVVCDGWVVGVERCV